MRYGRASGNKPKFVGIEFAVLLGMSSVPGIEKSDGVANGEVSTWNRKE